MTSPSAVDNKNDSHDDNPYLALREAKIARNQARLRELGLLSVTPKPTNKRHRTLVQSPHSAATAAKSSTAATSVHSTSSTTTTAIALRRSNRLSKGQTWNDHKINQKLDDPEKATSAGTIKEALGRPKRKRPHSSSTLRTTITNSVNTKMPYTLESSLHTLPQNDQPTAVALHTLDKVSVRHVALDPQQLVLGTNWQQSNDKINKSSFNPSTISGVLGRPMTQTGKLFVVQEAFQHAAILSNAQFEVSSSLQTSIKEDKQRLLEALSFNKYSGVLEWKNCAFLWVNLGRKRNNTTPVSDNEFMDGGRRITWYGGARMVDDSPIVQTLLQWGQEASDANSRLLLWCRKFDTEQNTFAPYVCLGRLSYQSHEPASYPLSFVWNLLDYERLQHHANQLVRETFQEFVTMTR